MKYLKGDKTVLNFFFTNLTKPIFATKNFHPEVWALMQARYSRSSKGLRESFLALLKENPKNFEKLKNEIEKTKGGMEAQHATEKAIQFMEKWVLGFGHSSVAEGAVIGLSLEGVSIIATKIIEDNRLCSYIEKSTRYVSFNEKSVHVPEVLRKSKHGKEIQEMIAELFEVYMDLHEPVLDYVKQVAPIESMEKGTNEAAWKRAVASRRFDAIRYLLPAGTMTSLGWTINARQLAHAICKLLSYPLKEVNEIGEQVKKEASKVLPSLLKFADKINYFVKTDQDMRTLAKSIKIDKENQEPVRLVVGPKHADEIVLSSILYKYEQDSYNKIMQIVKKMSKQEKENIFDTYLQKMGKFDYPLRELEHALFTFEIIMDYGAFRDLQRHRMCTQTNPLLTTDLGYDVPPDITNAGVEKQYRKAMDKVKKVYDKIKKKYPLEAQYIVPLGYRKRYLLTMNLREIYHLVKIRTTPLAHESYRKIAYMVYELMKEKYPLLSKWIVCNYSTEELGRLKSEEATERLKKVGPL